MSLVQHVSSIEGVDREPLPEEILPEELEGFAPIRRKISYDVFPPPPQVLVDSKAGTPAYKVSAVKRGRE